MDTPGYALNQSNPARAKLTKAYQDHLAHEMNTYAYTSDTHLFDADPYQSALARAAEGLLSLFTEARDNEWGVFSLIQKIMIVHAHHASCATALRGEHRHNDAMRQEIIADQYIRAVQNLANLFAAMVK